MDTFVGLYFWFCLELALETWVKALLNPILWVHHLGHTHSLTSVQQSGPSNQRTLLRTKSCLNARNGVPTRWKEHFLCPPAADWGFLLPAATAAMYCHPETLGWSNYLGNTLATQTATLHRCRKQIGSVEAMLCHMKCSGENFAVLCVVVNFFKVYTFRLQNKAFLQPAATAAMHCHPEGYTHSLPLIPPFLLVQNPSSKRIAPTDNMRPKSDMPKSIIGG